MINIRFSDIPEDVCFQVNGRTEYANAVYQAWQYVRGNVGGLRCFVECPDNLPQEWARVPDMVVPSHCDGLIELYRQWPKVVECASRLLALSEIVEESKVIGGIIEQSVNRDMTHQAVVLPFMRNIK